MNKKISFNGIEVLTREGDDSVYNLLVFVENIIERLESDLERVDENFNLHINMDFSPNTPPKHRFSVTSLSNQTTRKKVIKALEDASINKHNIAGTVRVELQIEDK